MTGGAGSSYLRRRATAKAISLLLGAIATLAVAASFATNAARHDLDGAQPVVATDGYLLAVLDGGVFAFGDPPFAGSIAHLTLAAHVVDGSLIPNSLGHI